MADTQPNNTADQPLPDDARDDRTAADVLSDDTGDAMPGGGGLKGPGTASGSMRATGGAAPNAPLADAMSAGPREAEAGAEARTRATGEEPDERHASVT